MIVKLWQSNALTGYCSTPLLHQGKKTDSAKHIFVPREFCLMPLDPRRVEVNSSFLTPFQLGKNMRFNFFLVSLGQVITISQPEAHETSLGLICENKQ